MHRILIALVVSASAAGCVAPGLEETVDALAREREELSRRATDLENRLAESTAREEALQRDLEAARRRPGKDVQLSDGLKGKGVRVTERGGDSVVELPSEVFFASGSSQLTEDGASVLAEVAAAVKEAGAGRPIRVLGHTDSDPVRRTKDKFHCNWDLSFERAHAVLHHLVEKGGFDSTQLAIEAHAENQPRDPENKARNRRVEIVIRR